MRQASEFAEKTAEICAAALIYGGTAATVAPFIAPLAVLAAIGISYRQDQRARCINQAADRALAALKTAPELADANLERARLLIDDARSEAVINREFLRNAAHVGAAEIRAHLIRSLMAKVPFEPDDHLERRAVETAFASAIDCLWEDADVRAGLTRDVVLDLARGQKLQVASSAEEFNKVRQALREGFEDVKAEFGRRVSAISVYDTTTSGIAITQKTQFALAEANTVILGWYSCSSDWWERTGQTLRSALDRLSDGATLVPQPWDFSVLDRDSGGLARAKSELWYALSGASGSMHAATVLHIGNALGPALPVDSRFEARLAKRGYLAEAVGERGFFDARAVEPQHRREMIKAGAIPITPDTRLILETLLVGRPLLIWDDSTKGQCGVELSSLLSWLAERGATICQGKHAASDDRWALEFVSQVFDIAVGQVPNPYRKLDHYLPSDADDYYGRDAEATAAREWMRRSLEVPGPACLRIGGPSGVGKSSFLNARVAPLAQDSGLKFVAFRPTDFEARPHHVFSPIREFCVLLEQLLGGRAGLEDHPLVDSPDFVRAGTAAARWIGQLRTKGTRLLIGVDQFEEVLDNISNGWNADAWHALLSLLADLVEKAGSLLCVTLETSRERLLDTELGGTLLQRASVIALSNNDETFLRKVICNPFAEVGFRLGEDIVATLVNETRRHQDEVGKDSSSLPLLSLKLYGLFSHLTRHRAFGRGAASNSFSSAVKEISLTDLEGYPLSIAEEIVNLAEQAWTETGGGSLDDLDTFIRPYVRVIPVEGSDAARIVLQSVPARSFRAMADRQAAFVRRRLIVPTVGGFRLVHESVIRRWSNASAWFERERDSLLRQAALAAKAADWAAKGRPPVAAPAAADIAIAARILNASAVDWTVGDAEDLVAGATIERDYCLALFSHATDPRTEIEASPSGSRYIHLAATYGMTDLLERFLDADPTAVAITRNDGRTLLESAAWGSSTTVALLLERKADPNQADDNGFTAIDAAIWGGSKAVFDILLPRADPSQSSEKRINPLYSASRLGSHQMLEQLELRGFRHDAPAKGGYTPLIGAAIGNDAAMFERCLAKGDPLLRTSEGLNTLDMLAQQGNVELLSRLIKHPLGAECLAPNPETGKTALMWACETLMPKTVAYLQKLGLDSNAGMITGDDKGRTALHFCLDWLHRYGERAPRFVFDKTRATLEALLEDETIDVSLVAENGDTAYSMLRHHQSLRDLIVWHPTFQTSTLPISVETPLERAIAEKDRELVKALLAAPKHLAVADRVDDKGKTPGIAMINKGFADIVCDLIRSGNIDPWQETANYTGLLFRAWEAGETNLLRLILDRMPERLSFAQFIQIVMCKSASKVGFLPSDFDTDDAILEKCLADGPDQLALEAALLRAGQLGNVAVFLRLVAAGANARQTDRWGRSILARSADRIGASPEVLSGIESGEGAGAAKAAKIIWSDNERTLLASGELKEISALIKSKAMDQLVDDWEREPADLVPDCYQDEVCALVAKKREKANRKGRVG